MAKESKFKSLFQEPTQAPQASEVKLEPAKHEPIILEEAPPLVRRPVVKEKTVAPKSFEQKGKNGHPDYCSTTAYIRKETYRDTKMWLLQSGDGKDYSELIEELLVAHLKANRVR